MAIKHTTVKAPGNTLAAVADWNANHSGTAEPDAHAIDGAKHTGSITDTQHGVRALANAHSHADLSNVTSDQHHAQSHNAVSHSDIASTGAEIDDAVTKKHNEAHTLASHSTKAHTELTGVTSDQHHAQSHTIVSHDTTATGAKLDTLTDNSIADALHRHSELVASDGAPDPAVSVDGDGIFDAPYQSACRAELASDFSCPSGVWTKVPFTSKRFDIQSEFNTTTHRWTAKKDGIYIVTGNGKINYTTAGALWSIRFRLNGVNDICYQKGYMGFATSIALNLVSVIQLSAGDYIELWAFNSENAARIMPSDIYLNFMSIAKIA